MKSVEQHVEELLALATPLDPIELPLLDAQGSVLAEDVPLPDGLMVSGTRLYSAHTGAAAAVGRERLLVRPHPRVVVVATGDELVDPGVELEEGQLYDANSWLLTAAARESGAVAFRVPVVADDSEKLTQVIEDQLVRADLLITSGGLASDDLLEQVLRKLGSVTISEISMEPGRTQGFGVIGPDQTPVVTLPGDPMSAYVAFEVFVRPMIRQMLGVERIHRPMVRAALKSSVNSTSDRRSYLPAQLSVHEGKYVVQPLEGETSLFSLIRANALMVADEPHLPAGVAVQVMMLSRSI